MANWLPLPSGQAVNMDLFVSVRRLDDQDDAINLLTANATVVVLSGADAQAVHASSERVHVGARYARY